MEKLIKWSPLGSVWSLFGLEKSTELNVKKKIVLSQKGLKTTLPGRMIMG